MAAGGTVSGKTPTENGELRWFRMYADFALDPLVQMLSFEDQRHYVMALCMKCKGLLDKSYPSPEFRMRVIAATLGLDKLAASEANRRLREFNLVDEDWQPMAWEGRAYKSDHDAAERQRKSRENRKRRLEEEAAAAAGSGVTTMSRDSHGLDQNRSDTETDQNARAGASVPRGTLDRDDAGRAPPTKGGRRAAPEPESDDAKAREHRQQQDAAAARLAELNHRADAIGYPRFEPRDNRALWESKLFAAEKAAKVTT